MIERTSSGIFDAWDRNGDNVARALKERDRPGHTWRFHSFLTGRDWTGLSLVEAVVELWASCDDV